MKRNRYIRPMILTDWMKRWRAARYFVIADPSDNSITLSKNLFRHMHKNAGVDSEATVFVFRIPEQETFGFMVNPSLDRPTQLCQVQYNEKYRCIGFETLCPSVGRMFYDFGLPALRAIKLSVSVQKDPSGKIYYRMEPPANFKARRP